MVQAQQPELGKGHCYSCGLEALWGSCSVYLHHTGRFQYCLALYRKGLPVAGLGKEIKQNHEIIMKQHSDSFNSVHTNFVCTWKIFGSLAEDGFELQSFHSWE